jgi:hypothetical protein
MTYDVEVVLRQTDYAVTETLVHAGNDTAAWTDEDVAAVLTSILRAIDRAGNPGTAGDRHVALRGFSWIVEPSEGQVVIAIEIPMGAAVAGPFDIEAGRLDAMIVRVLAAAKHPVVH